jgi:hypothetical protein
MPAVDYDDSRRREDLSVREVIIENHFISRAWEYYCDEIKLPIETWPDRMLLWPVGVADFVELKRPKGGRFQRGQENRHKRLRELGFTCVVIKTKAQVDKFFRERAATLGVARRPPMPKELRTGALSVHEYLAILKKK